MQGVLTAQEVAACNAAIDHHHHLASVYGADHERGAGNVLSGGSDALKGTTGRKDLGNFIGWESPWRDPFRDLLVHPRIVGILNEILGRGFRLDHGNNRNTSRIVLVHGSLRLSWRGVE